MQDLFFETVTVQRIGLLLKMVTRSDSTSSERDLVLNWLTELASDLESRLENLEIKKSQHRCVSQSSERFQ